MCLYEFQDQVKKYLFTHMNAFARSSSQFHCFSSAFLTSHFLQILIFSQNNLYLMCLSIVRFISQSFCPVSHVRCEIKKNSCTSVSVLSRNSNISPLSKNCSKESFVFLEKFSEISLIQSPKITDQISPKNLLPSVTSTHPQMMDQTALQARLQSFIQSNFQSKCCPININQYCVLSMWAAQPFTPGSKCVPVSDCRGLRWLQKSDSHLHSQYNAFSLSRAYLAAGMVSSPEIIWEAVGTTQQISGKEVLGAGTAACEMDSVSSDEFISPLFGLKHLTSHCSQHGKMLLFQYYVP